MHSVVNVCVGVWLMLHGHVTYTLHFRSFNFGCVCTWMLSHEFECRVYILAARGSYIHDAYADKHAYVLIHQYLYPGSHKLAWFKRCILSFPISPLIVPFASDRLTFCAIGPVLSYRYLKTITKDRQAGMYMPLSPIASILVRIHRVHRWTATDFIYTVDAHCWGLIMEI